jgi:hypothetical protein
MTEPTAPHVPPEHDPGLGPYAQWRQDEDKGARAAHDDARLPLEQRIPPDDVAAQGYAFWVGYTRHWAQLRDAGVIT